MIPLIPRTTVVIRSSGIQKLDWIIGCNSSNNNFFDGGDRKCDFGINLSEATKRIPESNEIERSLFIDSADNLMKRDFDHLLVYNGPSTSQFTVTVDRFTNSQRNLQIVLPSIGHSLTSMVFSWITIINIPVTSETTFHNLTLVGIEQIWHAYQVELQVTSCYREGHEDSYLHFWVPWNREDNFATVPPKRGHSVEMILKLNQAKPNRNDTGLPHLYLVLEPRCGFRLRLKLAVNEVIGQVLRYYGHLIVPWAAAILISALAIQLTPRAITKTPLILDTPAEKTYVIDNLARILRNNFLSVSLYGILPASPLIVRYAIPLCNQLGIDVPVEKYLVSFVQEHLNIMQFTCLQLFLFAFTYSILFLIATAATKLLLTINYCLIFAQKKYNTVESTNSNKNKMDELDKSYANGVCHSIASRIKVQRLPLAASYILLLLSLFTCSSVALLFGILLHCVQMFKYSFRSLNREMRRGSCEEVTGYNRHLTVLMLVVLAFLPTVPAGIVWFKNERPFVNFVVNFSFQTADLQTALILLSLNGIWQQTNLIYKHPQACSILIWILKQLAFAALICGQFNYSCVIFVLSVVIFIYNIAELLCVWSQKHVKLD